MLSMGKDTKNVLSSKELVSMRPRDRERYVQNLILNTIEEAAEGIILSDIVQKTALTRTTVTKHLEKLVALQQIAKDVRTVGKVSVSYYNRVTPQKSPREEFSGDSKYAFFSIDIEDDHWICLQQIEVDAYGAERVKGAITVNFDDFERFLKELHAYGAKVIRK